jgi:hypothetical protein
VSAATVNAYGSVQASATPTMPSDARNLPRVICQSSIGKVRSSSSVPLFRSSATARMVMAGTSTTKSTGATPKNCRSDAWPARNRVLKYSQPDSSRKPPSTM